ncbi:MAG TPA: type IV pilus biogenesis/stability protein PilW [Gallionellaceae bacterium]
MKWHAIMKSLAILMAVSGLSACVSDSKPSLDPERARSLAKVRTELAADYYGRKNYSEALSQLEQAIRADSRYAPAYDVRALIHMALLEDNEAESDFRRSLSLEPGNPETHNNYGWFLCQHGREREGIQQLLTATKDPLYGTPATAYLNAGICAKKIGQLSDAELYLQRAMILQPNLAVTLFEMADLAYAAGDYPRAKSNFMRYEKAVGGKLSAENLFLAVRIEHKLHYRSTEAAYAARLRKEFPDSRESAMLGQIR